MFAKVFDEIDALGLDFINRVNFHPGVTGFKTKI